MLDNLKQVLLQHKRFLAIFLLIVFVPSVILAYFGIQAINNERYRIQQNHIEQQRSAASTFKTDVQSLIEKEISVLRELAASRALIDRNDQTFSEMVSKRLQEKAVYGLIVVWNSEDTEWFPAFIPRPPGAESPLPSTEWRRFQSDLAKAERAEFRLMNFSEAVSLYRRILQRSSEDLVMAWIRSRIARCEVKRNNYKQALMIHRSMIEDFSDLRTESGRALEIVSRVEILDILLADNRIAEFFQESLQTLKRLDQRFWALDSDQVQMYMTLILGMINDAEKESSHKSGLANFQSILAGYKKSIENKLKIRRMAEAAGEKFLPDIRAGMKNTPAESPGLLKDSIQLEDRDVLVLLLPLDSYRSGQGFHFIASHIGIEDWREHIDAQIAAGGYHGFSLVLRSNLSDKVLYGDAKTGDQNPVLTDFFPENFPPWKVEIYQNEGVALGLPLYKNIFFWIILALLFIVFFGSGLIIRTLVQEVNLLNLKSEFIASVSHEFKTPLTAMGAVLERLMSNEVRSPHKIREYHRLLSHDSDKLKRLVKNVLDFSKIEEGKREYKLTECDITQLVRREVDSFLKENEMAGFEVDFSSENDIPIILADEEALSQALHNILDNAAKFSGLEKKIDVRIMRKGDRVEITVEDRGIGISEDERKKVFEKFYRGKRASSVSPTGTGLGLTLVKHIMDGHRGRVAIASQPGKGSCVTLALPLRKGE